MREVIEQINPVIRGWGTFYRKAHVRRLFHRLDGWIEHRLHAISRQTVAERHVAKLSAIRLIEEFGLVRLTHLIPGLVNR